MDSLPLALYFTPSTQFTLPVARIEFMYSKKPSCLTSASMKSKVVGSPFWPAATYSPRRSSNSVLSL